MIGMGKLITSCSKLRMMVFLIAVTAMLVLKNWSKYFQIGSAHGLAIMPSRALKSLNAMSTPYIGL